MLPVPVAFPRADSTAHEGVLTWVMGDKAACTDCHGSAHPQRRANRPCVVNLRPFAYNRLNGYKGTVLAEVLMRDLARVLGALADETRLRMLALLLDGREVCVCDFMTVLETTHSKASRHLRYLLNAGLVEDRREAVWAYYRLSETLDPKIKSVLEAMRPLLADGGSAALTRRYAGWLREKKASGGVCKRAGGGKQAAAGRHQKERDHGRE